MRKHNHASGFFSVSLAILGNASITVIKFVGFLVSGSSALFSESVHSFADTMNQSLLMVGIKRSIKKADSEHTYGYGQERFLWALISACGIFFLGAGVTAVNGINSMQHPESITIGPLVFAILAVSFIVESVTFIVAVRELKSSDPEASFGELLKDGDPTTIAVIYEDGVALIGVLVALASVTLVKLTGQHYWDGLGSVVIGLMLAVIAVVLIRKNRQYLIRKAIPEEVKEQIIHILEAEPAVERVINFKSSILDVGAYHVLCEIEFNGAHLLKKLQGNLKEEFEEIDGDFEEFKKFAVRYIDRVPRIVGNYINEIEEKIQSEIPSIIHIDIEIN
ncbi:cation diffusion facilitator family transporter [Candidatus Falkowbacteria bacterium]|nr:cation diffusion facilitator family transporter [Candidatus Falkowbacteria bacterium]